MDKNKWNLYLGWAVKRIALICFDVFAVTFSYWFALIIRFYVNFRILPTASAYIPAFLQFSPWYAAICVVVFASAKLYNSMWKYAGLNDLNRILCASAFSSIIHVVATVLFVMRMPVTYYVFGAIIQFLMIAASRFSYRIVIAERKKWRRKQNKAMINVMIVGVGETGGIVRKQIEEDRDNIAHPVCVFSSKKMDGAGMLDGLPVVSGMERLKEYVEKYQVQCVILADSMMIPEERKRIKAICREMDVEVQDFSVYFSSMDNSVLVRELLEHVCGGVDILIGDRKQSFLNGEDAIMSLNRKYCVKSISAKDNRLEIELVESRIVINDTSEPWGKAYEEQTGQEISFF